MSRYVTIAIE